MCSINHSIKFQLIVSFFVFQDLQFKLHDEMVIIEPAKVGGAFFLVVLFGLLNVSLSSVARTYVGTWQRKLTTQSNKESFL